MTKPTDDRGGIIRRRIGPLLAVFAAVLATACFDIEHRVTIAADGSGEVRLSLETDNVLPEGTRIDTILSGPDGRTEVHEYTENGRFFHVETARFAALNELALQDDEMTVSVRDRALWGAGPARATFRRTVRPIGDGGDSFGLVQRLLTDRTYSFSVTLPGWIDEIEAVRIDDLEAVPQRDGNTITWRIPLGLFARADTVTFTVHFNTFGDLKSSGTRPVTDAPESVSPLLGRPG
ncbi:MAG: hypothetical protein ACFB6R_16645 [Alphaproteobacteria bacterium]